MFKEAAVQNFKRWLGRGVFLFGLEVPATAQAYFEPPPAHTGFQNGIRLGTSLPLGKMANSSEAKLAELTRLQVPLLFEIGYKPIAPLLIGIYFGGSVGPIGQTFNRQCKMYDASCQTFMARVGLQAIWGFRPDKMINPWAGLGFGWEYLYMRMAADQAGGFSSYSGFELAMIQGGADFRLTERFAIGPYAACTFARFRHARIQIDPVDQSNKIDSKDRGLHEWLTFGIKMTFSREPRESGGWGRNR